jgi:pimeloyl-ACP methyl ester carboxylesterase
MPVNGQTYFQRIDCIKCGKPDGLQIIPFWYHKIRDDNPFAIHLSDEEIMVQIKGGGHGLMYQYPDIFNKVLQTFLSTTTTNSG